MLASRSVGEMVGRLCRREQRSPWRHALQGSRRRDGRGVSVEAAGCSHATPCLLSSTALQCSRPLCTAARLALPNFEVKGAVDTILLRAEDASQMVGHGCSAAVWALLHCRASAERLFCGAALRRCTGAQRAAAIHRVCPPAGSGGGGTSGDENSRRKARSRSTAQNHAQAAPSPIARRAG